MEQGREERVRARAYEIWEREGRTEGSHEAHWQQAEREPEGERAGAPDTSEQSDRGSAASAEVDADAPPSSPGETAVLRRRRRDRDPAPKGEAAELAIVRHRLTRSRYRRRR